MNVNRPLLVGLAMTAFFVVGGLILAVLIGKQTYTVKGRVAGIEDGKRVLFVEHEKIPGYMPAMTMPLPVADTSMTGSLQTGDAIEFRLAVSGDSAWIAAIRSIPDSAVARHPARTIRSTSTGRSGRRMLREGDRVPADLTLTNQTGQTVQIGDYRSQALVLTFIYTRCPLPTYCPRMSKQFADLQPTLRTRYGSRVQLLSISFDPAYDTPAVLRDYATRYTDRLDTWTFATGDSTQVQRATEHFGVFTKQKGGQITHNLTTALIGPKGRVRRTWRGNDWRPEDVLSAVNRAMTED